MIWNGMVTLVEPGDAIRPTVKDIRQRDGLSGEGRLDSRLDILEKLLAIRFFETQFKDGVSFFWSEKVFVHDVDEGTNPVRTLFCQRLHQSGSEYGKISLAYLITIARNLQPHANLNFAESLSQAVLCRVLAEPAWEGTRVFAAPFTTCVATDAIAEKRWTNGRSKAMRR